MTLMKNGGRLFPATPSFFDDFFTRNLWDWGPENTSSAGTTIPAVNVREIDDHFEVEMAAPGLKKGDFEVELEGNVLTISSQKESRNDEKDKQGYSRKEFCYESFTRTLQLPKDVVDEEKIEAKYENGVLRLNIPKKEPSSQKHRKVISVA